MDSMQWFNFAALLVIEETLISRDSSGECWQRDQDSDSSEEFASSHQKKTVNVFVIG
jgi:hypothetical protein